ncbi:MAG: hypothetical protein KGJ78_00395 [Alphaproteobacteria bacterium]|nr:hypothetical protein [Alphaproteobacteria bacterium]
MTEQVTLADAAADSDPQPFICIFKTDRRMPFSSVLPVLHVMRDHGVRALWFESFHYRSVPDEPTVKMDAPIMCIQPMGPWAPDRPVIVIGLGNNGRTTWNGIEVAADAFEVRLAAASKNLPQPAVHVRIASKVSYQSVTFLLWLIQYDRRFRWTSFDREQGTSDAAGMPR